MEGRRTKFEQMMITPHSPILEAAIWTVLGAGALVSFIGFVDLVLEGRLLIWVNDRLS